MLPSCIVGADRDGVLDSAASLMLANQKWLTLALRLVEEGLDSDPGNHELKTTEGALLVELGRSSEGLPLLKKCYEHSEPSINRSLAAFYLALNAKESGEPFADLLEEAKGVPGIQKRILQEFPQP